MYCYGGEPTARADGRGPRKSATNDGHGVAEGHDGNCSTASLQRWPGPTAMPANKGMKQTSVERTERSQLIPSVGRTFADPGVIDVA